MITRRSLLHLAVTGTIAASGVACSRATTTGTVQPFRLRYALASALYGDLPLDVILPEVAKTSSDVIDIWCRVHGTQREQITAMGDDAFAVLLDRHQVRLGVSTRYPSGPFGLRDEMTWLKHFGGGVIVTGSPSAKEPSGAEANVAIDRFLEDLKPHLDWAASCGVTIAIENHRNQLLCHPDALRRFADQNRSPQLGIALAFHHLYPWQADIPQIIHHLGARNLPFVYFQEHVAADVARDPQQTTLLQLPGHGGGLDYRPLLTGLRDVGFTGLAEIFTHPTPRGIPILPRVADISAAVMRSRAYVDSCLA